MINYIQNPIEKYLNDLSSNKPAPGGGSASALVGCIGVSCLLMVANFTKNKIGYEKHQNRIKKIIKKLEKTRKELSDLVNKDVTAYEKVANAYKLPKNTEKEIKFRKKEIKKTLISALKIPKEILSKCLEIANIAEELSEIGNKNLITDVGCGIYFLKSCAEGAKLNIDINLKFLKDKNVIKKVEKETTGILKELEKNFKKTRKKVELEIRK